MGSDTSLASSPEDFVELGHGPNVEPVFGYPVCHLSAVGTPYRLENDLGFYRQMNDNGGGVVTVSIEALQAAIDEAGELELDEDTVRVLGEDIAAAKADNNESVDYDCF